MSQRQLKQIQLTLSRTQQKKLAREKYADNSQSQPPNVYPADSSNSWTPNLPPMVMQNMPQDSWSQPQVPWSQPQDMWSQPQPQGPWSQPQLQDPWSQTQPQGPWLQPQPQEPWLQPQPQEPWLQPQPQEPWLQPQPQEAWSHPQVPWSQPQANTPNNMFNFGPTNIHGNCFPQNNIEQPFPHQSNQPKKIKKKMKVQQQPKKKLKSAELSLEEKRKRRAELKQIEQKYRQVVFIHNVVSKNRPPPPPPKPKAKVTPSKQQMPVGKVAPTQIKAAVPNKPKANVTPSKQQAPVEKVAPTQIKAPVVSNKPKANVTPSKQQAPVEKVAPPQIKAPAVPNKPKANVTPSKKQAPVGNVAPRQIKTIGNTTITPIPSGQTLQPPATGLTTTEPKKRKHRSGRKTKKNQSAAYTPQVQVVNTSGAPSQYQAPHQDEPEDLTDDLAPNMAGGQQQQGTQPKAVAAENKLNFKFQRSVPKNPDWSEFQNKFRRIGGGSPEPAEPEGARVKQEPDHSINTESKPRTQSQSSTGSQQTVTGTQQIKGSANAAQKPPVTPKVEIVQQPQKKEAKSQSKQQQPQPNLKSMKINSQQNSNQKFMPYPYNPYDNYPKGIPKSFLQQDPQAPDLKVPQPYQAGIPKSFLNQDPQVPDPHVPQPYQAGIPKSFLQQAAQTQQPNVAGIPKSFLKAQQAAQSNPALNYAKETEYQARDDQPSPHIDLPSWILASQAQQEPEQPKVGANTPMFPTLFSQHAPTDRPYSPTDVYSEIPGEEEPHEGSQSPDILQSNQKRQSAFSRLGPLAQPKKPKLTINLMLNKDQAVREVVDETDESFRYVPVHLRKSILQSEDETVRKYLPFWPWKRNMCLRKTVSARHSKSAMMLEQEQMESGYEKNSLFIQVSVKGYPKTWNKEDVLDAILDCVKGKHFIPLFIEFTPQECKFLVIRSKDALIAIHKLGFCVRAADAELTVSISLTDTSLNQIDLIPRLVLRKRLTSVYDGENTLNLSEFFTEKDVSHFLYFPLNRHTNQLELIQLQSAVAWEYLTELNLSHNRLTSIAGFDLCKSTPRLKRLDLSHNRLDRLPGLLPLRGLPLRGLRLEGNPLCHDYVDAAHYVKVVRMMFSEVRELDGVRITLKGDLPPMRRNYCPEAAVPVVEKFLETFFPLLEAYDDRGAIEDMYDKDAVLTITFRYKIRYGTAYRYFRNLFMHSRSLEEGELESIDGATAITALLLKWPAIQHDRYAMTVDVMHHDDYTTVLRIGGILKLTAETLAEDEHLLTFTRTVVLHTRTGAEYKIHNEMLSWDVPREEAVRHAFNVTTVRPRQLSLKLESPPDEDLKSKLIDIFVKLADIDKKRGARCLELKNWDLRSALEYYISLLKIDDLSALSPPKESTPAPQAS